MGKKWKNGKTHGVVYVLINEENNLFVRFKVDEKNEVMNMFTNIPEKEVESLGFSQNFTYGGYGSYDDQGVVRSFSKHTLKFASNNGSTNTPPSGWNNTPAPAPAPITTKQDIKQDQYQEVGNS